MERQEQIARILRWCDDDRATRMGTMRRIIVDWLGERYDREDKYGGNPDYVTKQEVEALVDELKDVLD